MILSKQYYWSIELPYYMDDHYWRKKIQEDFSEEFGTRIDQILFQSEELAIEMARKFLIIYNSSLSWAEEERLGEKELRQTFEEYLVSSEGVTLRRGGEGREKKSRIVKKKVVIDGQDWSREEEEVILGEWIALPDFTQNITLYVFRKEICIGSES